MLDDLITPIALTDAQKILLGVALSYVRDAGRADAVKDQIEVRALMAGADKALSILTNGTTSATSAIGLADLETRKPSRDDELRAVLFERVNYLTYHAANLGIARQPDVVEGFAECDRAFSTGDFHFASFWLDQVEAAVDAADAPYR